MPIMPLPRHVVNDAVARAIAEDQGGRGDVTSLACIPAKAEAKFYVNAREAGVVCGFQPALAAIWQCDPKALVSPQMDDGDTVKPGDVLISVTGRARGLLAAERILLNFMGRMSGIMSMRSRAPAPGSPTPARPRRAFALLNYRPCRPAAVRCTASASMTPS